MLQAVPHSMEPLIKTPRARRYSLRFPRVEPNQPTLGVITAEVIMAPVCTHWASASSARKLVMMVGKARFSAVTFKPTVVSPSIRGTVIHQWKYGLAASNIPRHAGDAAAAVGRDGLVIGQDTSCGWTAS